MWTQFNESFLTSASSASAYQIYVDNVDNVSEQNWVVIEPQSVSCEIRRITAISGTGPYLLTLDSMVTLANAHAADTVVYYQTSPVWDIRLFDANPEQSATNNATSINNAVDDCHANGGGVVSIPKGTYLVEKLGGKAGCIDVQGKSDIKFIGEGMQVSILKINGGDYGSTDIHMFECSSSGGNSAENLEWHDLTLDGNRDNVTASEQSHLIQSNDGVNYNLTRVEFYKGRRDGIKAIDFTNLYVGECRFISCGRSGITVQRNNQKVTIIGNYFEDTNDQDIDFEPTGDADSPRQFIIADNTMIRREESALSLTLTGDGASTQDENNIVSNNIFQGGALYVQHCSNVIVSGNLIYSGTDSNIPFHAIKIVDKFLLENNVIINNSENVEAIYMTPHSGSTTLSIQVLGNTVQNGECTFENCHDVTFSGNRIQTNAADAVGFRYRINVSPASVDLENWGNLVVTNNQIEGVATGIKVSNQHHDYTFQLICIDNNVIQSASLDYGILIEAPSDSIKTEYWEKAMIGTANVISNASTAQIDVFGSYLIALNPYQESWISKVSPEGAISAPQGSLAIDKSIEADNKYCKNTQSGNTGWVLCSEVNKQLLLQDDFIDTSTTPLPSHTPAPINVFSPNVWADAVGQWEINGQNEAKVKILSSSTAIAVIDTFADGTLKAIFRTTSSGTNTGGIVFRYDDANNYWRFYFQNASGAWHVLMDKIVAGSTTNILASTAVTLGASLKYNLKIMMEGNFITAFYNDLPLLTVKDSFNNTKTKHGMIITGSTNTQFCDTFKMLTN